MCQHIYKTSKEIRKQHKPTVMCLPVFCILLLHGIHFLCTVRFWAASFCSQRLNSALTVAAHIAGFWEDKVDGLSDLLWFKSDTQAQFGHPILFQQFEVWTQCQAKGSGDPFYKPIVFRGVTRSVFGPMPPLQEEHLHQISKSGKLPLGDFAVISQKINICTSVQRMIFPFSLYSDFWNIFVLLTDSMDFPSMGLITLLDTSTSFRTRVFW